MTQILEWREGTFSTSVDPHADWLREVDNGDIRQNSYMPVLFCFPALKPKKTRPRNLLADLRNDNADSEALSTRIRGVASAITSSNALLNTHDFIHWLHMMLTGKSELIIFVKGNEEHLLQGIYDSIFDLLPFDEDDKPVDKVILTGAPVSKQFFADPNTGVTDELLMDAVVQYLEKVTAPLPANSNVVISGIIDHAIGFANERFRSSLTSSRVAAAWIQQAKTVSGASGLAMGKWISRLEINTFLGQLSSGQIEDEFDLYRLSGASTPNQARPMRGDQPLLRPVSHGTQVLDLAAGYDASEQIDDIFAVTQNPIITVQLPTEIVAATNGCLHELYVKTSLNWIWHTTLLEYGLAGINSLVVNYSFGDYSGRHDGLGILDSDFDYRLANQELAAITLPAGNGYHTQIHAELSTSELGEGEQLNLVVQPDDKEVTFVQFWLDNSYDAIPLQFKVTPPGGPTSGGSAGKAPNTYEDLIQDGSVVARIYYLTDSPNYVTTGGAGSNSTNRDRTFVTLAIRATARDESQHPIAPSGIWKLEFSTSGDETLVETIEMWVERGDSIEGFPQRGRQAYLEHPDYERYLDNGRLPEDDSLTPNSPIKRFGTIGANANSRRAIVVGAARKNNPTRIAPYSAARTSYAGEQPVFGLFVENSAARPNRVTTGTVSSSMALLTGTSAASAFAARKVVAEYFANPNLIGKPGSGEQIRTRLIYEANRPIPADIQDANTPQFPLERIGAGMVNSPTYRELDR